MDLIQFFGRFHVLVLHLPIGILLMAAVLELYALFFNKQRTKTLQTIWLWGALSACGAALLGYLLSLGGGYNADAVFVHKAFAFAVIGCAFICWFYFCLLSRISSKFAPFITTILCFGQLFLLFSTGHYGANMTHGSTYLFDYAPDPVRKLAGLEAHPTPREKVTDLAQAHVYLDLIGPVLEQKCVACHNDDKSKGKLNLTRLDSLFKGGQSGPAVVAGDLNASELYRRITLDSHDKKFMPAGGKPPLSDIQVKTLAWWIEAGLPQDKLLGELELDDTARSILATQLGLQAAKGSWPLAKTEPLSQTLADELTAAGFVVKQISQDVAYIDLDYSVSRQAFTDQALEVLLKAKDHVAWLNLANSQVSDPQLAALSQLTHLIKLRLEKNPITSQGINHLAGLDQLTYLNLYKTKVDDQVFSALQQLPALKNLYLTETLVSEQALTQWQQKNKTSSLQVIAANYDLMGQNNEK
ncbi:c-type cytochrome domain-containing protein [Gayadomonas joobiniege]|uniref:c-type cytochrome domain-containing protein n=1 Tax=Gayadomonas joobiniege TaxID=1234606 RepID=UPI00037658A7|nr:c-type cytochrome domain-containing protein [Gayadomonas joobiniege]